MKIHTWSTMSEHEKIRLFENRIKFNNKETLTDIRAIILCSVLFCWLLFFVLLLSLTVDVWLSWIPPIIQASILMAGMISFWFWVKFVRRN